MSVSRRPRTDHDTPPSETPGTMEDAISARYQWNPDAMSAALAAHQKLAIRPVFRVILGVLLLMYLLLTVGLPLSMIASPTSSPVVRRNAGFTLVVALLAWGFAIHGVRTRRFLKWRSRRIFRTMAGGGKTFVDWSLGPDQVTVRTGLSAATFFWPAFVKVVETREGFLFYHQASLFNWIPGHAFASEAELKRFIELARARATRYIVLAESQYLGKPDPTGLDEI
jgi:hypothetical protein